MVEVTQEDREAAASGYFAWCSGNPVIPDRMKAGQADDHSMVQAFARHRIAARNAAQQEITALRARIAEDQAQIAALTTYRENLRDEVIELRARIAELEAERAEWVEVERLRMGKATPPTPPA